MDNFNFGINAKGTSNAAKGFLDVASSAKVLGKESLGMQKKASGISGVFSGVLSVLGGVKKSADDAARGTSGLGRVAGRASSQVNSLSNAASGLKTAMGPLIAVFAAFRAAQGVANFIADSNEAFLTQAEAVRGATQAQKEFSSQLQLTLGVGDEVSLGIMQQAKALGIADDQIQEATKAAIGLSEATGEGVNEALKKVNRALQGNVDAFSEAIPGIQDMASEEEKLVAVNELISRGLDKQAQKMEGLQGIQTRASNSLGDLMEVFGQILAPIRAVISQGIAVFAEAMQSVLAPAAELAARAMENLPRIFEYVKKGVVGAITGIEIVITNLPTIAELVAAKVQLTWVQLSENAKHFFTSAIPSYLSWFADNWKNILFDAANLATTIVTNYFKRQVALYKLGFQAALDMAEWFASELPNMLYSLGEKALQVVTDTLDRLGKAFATAWDYITSYFAGGSADATATLTQQLTQIMDGATQVLASPPRTMQSYAEEFGKIMSSNLTEGFEATTQSLPEIIERQITGQESSLQATIAELGGKLGGEFSSKFNDRMKSIADGVGGVTETANLALSDMAKSTKAGKSVAEQMQAVESRLLTRGRADDPNAMIADNTKATVAELMKTNAKLDEANRRQNQPVQVVEFGV